MTSTGAAPMEPEACIQRPLEVAQAIFALAEGVPAWEEQFESVMKQMFSNPESLAKIPSLNCTPLDQLPVGSLVRYRCMVQDVRDPEYYMGTYNQADVHTGHSCLATAKYRDAIPAYGSPIEAAAPMERLPLHCTAIPGQTLWAMDAIAAECAPAAVVCAHSSGTQKRRADDSDDIAAPITATTEDSKRRAAAVAPALPQAVLGSHMCMLCPPASLLPGPVDALRGQQRNASAASGAGTQACLVKVYDAAGQQIRVNQAMEFVGILSIEPGLATFDSARAGDDLNWREEHHAPYSVLPRLHAVFHRVVDLVMEPRFPPTMQAEVAAVALLPTLVGTGLSLRDGFVSAATAALGGDRLAAEYLLLHCISGVYHRTHDLCLGQMNLNLSGVPRACPPMHSISMLVQELLSSVLPLVHVFPFSVESLNSTVMVPRKDYEQNRLVAGMLQLSDTTSLVLDETTMGKGGALGELGVANIQALKEMLHSGVVNFDFSFNAVTIPVNVPTLTLSSQKSMLPNNVTVPLQPAGPGQRAPLGPEDLAALQGYVAISRARNNVNFRISDAADKHAQADFVQCRKQNHQLTADDFHRWLTLARLLALSYGEASLTPERWESMKALEHARMARQPDEYVKPVQDKLNEAMADLDGL